MTESEIPIPHDLPNKPLVEAIFELRWALRELDQGIMHDPGYRIAMGRYYDSVKEDYPTLVDLPISQMPEDMAAYSVRQQFRAGPDKWPVTQIGPGILSVNDTKGYTWKAFSSRISSAVEAIFDSYPSEIHEFKPTRLELRYMDAFQYDPQITSPTHFMKDYLHTEICPDSSLSQELKEPGRFRLDLNYTLDTPKADASLSFATATHKERGPSILLTTVLRCQGDDVPDNKASICQWVDEAHGRIDKWFFTLCRGALMETFNGDKADANTNS